MLEEQSNLNNQIFKSELYIYIFKILTVDIHQNNQKSFNTKTSKHRKKNKHQKHQNSSENLQTGAIKPKQQNIQVYL